MCSTPKGIKGWDRQSLELEVRIDTPCSTPKGIKGWDRIVIVGMAYPPIWCSTPKGIKGWDRREGRGSTPCRNSAQRQKASKVGTEAKLKKRLTSYKCSTPKGIKGWDRNLPKHGGSGYLRCSTPKGIKGWDRDREYSSQPRISTVLNAKRHQRLGQRGGTDTVNSYTTVLNAKRHQRLGQQNPLFCLLCPHRAQRQKASKVGTAQLTL